MGAKFDESTGNAELWCDMCLQPLTHSDKYGMHCDNECEREIDKACASILPCIVSWHDGISDEDIKELAELLTKEEK